MNALLFDTYNQQAGTYTFYPIYGKFVDRSQAFVFNSAADALQFSEAYHETPCFAVAAYYLMLSIKGEQSND